MKSIFDQATREEIIGRIMSLKESSSPAWGKMSVSQMIRHCRRWDEMALGKKRYRQVLLGRVFGKIALKSIMKDEPMKKNMPTVGSFKMEGETDVAEEKEKWILSIQEYQHAFADGFVHPFFGKLSKEQTGQMVYKHADHHLKQFRS